MRTLLDALAVQTGHLKSVIGQVKTDGMVANGAPPTYMTQWNTAQTELKYLLGLSGRAGETTGADAAGA